MNSREKGKRGERWWRDELRANGYEARRGQQFSGSPDSPDVVCEDLSWIHFEVKAVERLNIEDAMDQVRRDCGSKTPILAHKKNHRKGIVSMDVDTFFRLLRGDFPQPIKNSTSPRPSPQSPQSGEGENQNLGADAAAPHRLEEPLRGNTSPLIETQEFGMTAEVAPTAENKK